MYSTAQAAISSFAGSARAGSSAAASPAANNKPTYVSVLGLARAKALAEELREEAQAALSRLGGGARRLSELADFIVLRKF